MTRYSSDIRAALCCFSILAASCGRSSEYVEPPPNSYVAASFTLATDSASERLKGAAVTPAFFTAARARPLIGRFFSASEYDSSSQPVVVISHATFTRTFQSDPQIIGRLVRVNDREARVVGVAPDGIDWPSGASLWVPQVGR